MTAAQADRIIELLYFLDFLIFSSIVVALLWFAFSRYFRW